MTASSTAATVGTVRAPKETSKLAAKQRQRQYRPFDAPSMMVQSAAGAQPSSTNSRSTSRPLCHTLSPISSCVTSIAAAPCKSQPDVSSHKCAAPSRNSRSSEGWSGLPTKSMERPPVLPSAPRTRWSGGPKPKLKTSPLHVWCTSKEKLTRKCVWSTFPRPNSGRTTAPLDCDSIAVSNTTAEPATRRGAASHHASVQKAASPLRLACEAFCAAMTSRSASTASPEAGATHRIVLASIRLAGTVAERVAELDRLRTSGPHWQIWPANSMKSVPVTVTRVPPSEGPELGHRVAIAGCL